MGRAWIIVGMALALAACAPRAVAPVTNAEPTELRLKAGDSIRVVTKNRERLSLEITEIRPTEIVGVTLKPEQHETLPKGQLVVVRYEDLALVAVRGLSPTRTAVAVPMAVLVVAGGMVIEAGFAAMAATGP